MYYVIELNFKDIESFEEYKDANELYQRLRKNDFNVVLVKEINEVKVNIA